MIINGIAPNGMKSLIIKIESHGEVEPNRTDYIKSYCYKKGYYVVYRKSTVGDGYILSKNLPDKLNCYKVDKKIIEKNELGIYIGMYKADVEGLINITQLADDQSIRWKSTKMIRSLPFDHNTHLKLIFKNNILEYIKV
ncbi:MAG: hypothetical protein OEW60_04055, partial [Thiovulaceae bacterium]|nr:hypothetical protein [Sulfurimonadaceae bacterium]